MIRRAFTLIELLVVIAVIAVLVGIILPALGHAKRAGQSAVSLSNLRQWGAVQTAYSLDFKGSFVNPFDIKTPQLWTAPWFDIISNPSLSGGPVTVYDFRDNEYTTEMFAATWTSLVSYYLNGQQTACRASLSPLDLAAHAREDGLIASAQADPGAFLFTTSYWASPTLWLSASIFSSSSRVPVGPGDARYWRRNRFDDATDPCKYTPRICGAI